MTRGDMYRRPVSAEEAIRDHAVVSGQATT